MTTKKKTKSTRKKKVEDKSKIKELTPTPIPLTLMRALVETYYDFQDQRIIAHNRIKAATKIEKMSMEEFLEKYGMNEIFSLAEEFEKRIASIFIEQLKLKPIYIEYLSQIQGIGKIISAGLLGYIVDIGKFDSISSLWQYAGFGMNSFCPKCKEPTWESIEYKNAEGKSVKAKRLKSMRFCRICNTETYSIIQKRHAGFQSNWNDKFKVLGWKISHSFEKQKASKSFYRRLYDQIKPEERRKHPERIVRGGKPMYNDGHIRNMALRRVTKYFLANLWLVWRRYEGLPIKEPYIFGEGEHHTLINPKTDRGDFKW